MSKNKNKFIAFPVAETGFGQSMISRDESYPPLSRQPPPLIPALSQQFNINASFPHPPHLRQLPQQHNPLSALDPKLNVKNKEHINKIPNFKSAQQLQLHFQQEQPRQVSSEVLLQNHIELVIRSNGYVEAVELHKVFQDKIQNLNKLNLFKNIQSMNKCIDATIDCFWHCNSIHIYLELKDFVVETLNKWKQGSNYRSFEEVGLGYLSRNPKVVEYFQFFDDRAAESDYLAPVIDTKTVILIAKKFINDNREMDVKQTSTQTSFDKFLRSHLGKQYSLQSGRKLGIHVDFKELFHKLIKLRYAESKEVDSFVVEQTTDLRSKLAASVAALRSSLTYESGTERVQLVRGLLRQQKVGDFDSALKFLSAALRREEAADFRHQLYALSRHAFRFDLVGFKENGQFTATPLHDEVGVAGLWGILQGADGDMLLGFSAGVAEHLLRHMHTSVVGMMALLCTELHTSALPLDGPLDVDSAVRATLKTMYTADIPDFVLDALMALVSGKLLIDHYEALSVDCESSATKKQKVRIELNLQSVLDKSRALWLCLQRASAEEVNTSSNKQQTPRKKRGGGKVSGGSGAVVDCMLARHYVGLLCAAVLFQRIAVVEGRVGGEVSKLTVNAVLPEMLAEVMREEKFLSTDGVTTGSGSSTTAQQPPVSALVTNVLRQLESKLVARFQVPAFECLKLGPFLQCAKDLRIPDMVEKVLESSVPRWSNLYSDLSTSGTGGPPVTHHTLDSDTLNDVIKESLQELTSQSSALRSTHLDAVDLLSRAEELVVQRCSAGSFQELSGGVAFTKYLQELVAENGIVAELCARVSSLSLSTSHSHHQEGSVEGSEEAATKTDFQLVQPAGQVFSREQLQVFQCAAEQFLLVSHWRESGSEQQQDSIFGSHHTVSAAVTSFLTGHFNHVLATAIHAEDVSNMVIESLVSDGVLERSLEGEFKLLRSAEKIDSIVVFAAECGSEAREDGRVSADVAIDLLLKTPLGASCSEFTQWNSQFSRNLLDREGGNVAQCSLEQFLVMESATLQRLSRTMVFVHVGDGDFVPVPTATPSADEISGAMEETHYSAMATWLVAAVSGVTDRDAVELAVRAVLQRLFDSGDSAVVQVLYTHCLRVLNALPSSALVVRKNCLLLLIRAMAHHDVLNISPETVQQELFCAAVKLGEVVVLSALGDLAARYCVTFSVLYELVVLRAEEVDHSSVVADVSSAAQNSFSEAVSAAPVTVANSEQKQDSGVIDAIDATTQLTEKSAEDAVSKIVSKVDRKATIAAFLQSDFGYSASGERPPEDGPQGRNLRNALDLLSKSLYTSEVHFVMELLQNADDNYYGPGVHPVLKFQLHRDALLVFNNELGFSPADIFSVCKVGGSTKVERKDTHIGQKGIGFKSVFSVSDHPEIHSNGFHIRFSREISMLEPVWIDDPGQWPDTREVSEDGLEGVSDYETCLRLQFDNKTRKNFSAQRESLAEVLDEKLMLFLNKLQVLVLEDKSNISNSNSGPASAAKVVLSRDVISADWTSVSLEYANYPGKRNATSESFWLTKKDSFAPLCKRNDVVVASTEVAIAFKFHKSVLARDHSAEMEYHADDEENFDPSRDANRGVRYRLELDEPEEMFLYAFLPTKSAYFKFIVQADFLLATNRESLTVNDWNQELLNRVPRLFVDLILEMSVWMWKANSSVTTTAGNQKTVRSAHQNAELAAECPHLHQVEQLGYQVSLTAHDLLALLPRKKDESSTSRRFNKLIDDIYAELRQAKFLKCQSGDFCSPAELLSTHHLEFDPAKLISEQVLFAATGKRYSHADLPLDDKLCGLLGIERFSEHSVLRCLESLSEQNITKSIDPSASISLLCKLLLILDRMSGGGNAPKPANSGVGVGAKTGSSRGMVPFKVITRGLGAGAPHVEERSRIANIVPAIRKLTLWPVTVSGTDSFTSLESSIILLRGSDQFSPAQRDCLDLFRSRLLMLAPSVFIAAEKVQKGDEAGLRALLFKHFKCGNVAAGGSGGFEELSPLVVVNTVILPEYERQARAATHNDEPVAKLDRITASAFLAFYFMSNVRGVGNSTNNPLGVVAHYVRSHRIVVPTLRAGNRNRVPMVWQEPISKVVQKHNLDCEGAPTEEIHLGVEVQRSATNSLASLSIHSTLRQLEWTIVDPLAAALVFQVRLPSMDTKAKQTQTSGPSPEYLAHEEVCAVFRQCSSQEVNLWQSFLMTIGVTDLFGVYKVDGGQLKAPSLFSLLGQLLKNGREVQTDGVLREEAGESVAISPKTAPWTSTEVESSEANFAEHELSLRLPVYQPHSNLAKPLAISSEVYGALMRLAGMIEQQVLSLLQTERANMTADAWFLQELRKRAWFPVVVLDDLARSLASGSDEKLCVVASPQNIYHFYVESQSRNRSQYQTQQYQQHQQLNEVSFPLGQHAFYVPAALSLSELNLFRVQVHHSTTAPPETQLDLFVWMLRQTDCTIFSSVAAMHNMYVNMHSAIQDRVLDGECVAQVREVLSLGRPFLWLPDQVHTDSYGEQRTDCVTSGRFYPLSRVFAADPTETKIFSAESVPVKDFSKYYGVLSGGNQDNKGNHQRVKQFSEYFGRRRCCYVCQAVEGMFGATGQVIGDTFGKQTCRCIDVSFGKFFPHLGGLMRASPSLSDILALLKCYRDELLLFDDSDHFSVVKSVREEEQARLMGVVRSTLEAISREIWKCFRIKNCLHAYSPASLRLLRHTFTTEELLPVLEGNAFVTAAPAPDAVSQDVKRGSTFTEKVIAVDDVVMFELFQRELSALDVKWVDGKVAHRDFFAVGGGSGSSGNAVQSYDIDAFEEESEQFLNLPTHVFGQSVQTLPGETFFAPNNTLALLEFLGVQKLSSFVSMDWRCEHSVGRDQSGVFSLLNNLLTVTQTYLWHSESLSEGMRSMCGILATSERVKKLLGIKVQSCKSVSRYMALKMGDLEDSALHCEDFWYDVANNTLCVDAKISKTERKTLCIQLVMSAVRIELALKLLNQNLDIMAGLQKVLEKCADFETSKLLSYLDVEFNRDQFPGTLVPWALAAETAEEPAEVALDEHCEAMQGVQRLASESTKRSKAVVAPKAKEVSAEHEEYLRTKAQKDALLKGVTLAEMESRQVVAVVEADMLALATSEEVLAVSEVVQPFNPALFKAQQSAAAAPTGPPPLVTASKQLHGDDHSSTTGSLQYTSPLGATHLHPQVLFDSGSVNSAPQQHHQQLQQPQHSSEFTSGADLASFPALQAPPFGYGANMAGHMVHNDYSHSVPVSSDTNNVASQQGFAGAIHSDFVNNFHSSGGGGGLVGALLTHTQFGGDGVSHFDPSLVQQHPHPQFAQPMAAVGDLVRMTVSDEEVDQIVAEMLLQQYSASTRGKSGEEQQFISPIENLTSGRVGERVAFIRLRHLLAGQFASITWLNEAGESGLPYDIEIVLMDGSKKFCEVKSRSAGHNVNQWFISPKEVACAVHHGADYFCVLLWLAVHPVTQRYRVEEMTVVGRVSGLADALRSKQAQLILQANHHQDIGREAQEM